MKASHALFLIISLFLVANTGCTQSNALESQIDDYLKPLLDGNNFNGSILVYQNGQIRFEKSYGYANLSFGIKNSSQTRYQIASLSKTFTAAAVMLLYERNSIGLNDTITKYIPELSHFHKVTIHHLLGHYSGIPDINRQPVYGELESKPQTPSTLVAAIKDFELFFDPGEKYSYSNSNYNILARLIEVVSGQEYGEFLKENIFIPLELENTGHRGDMIAPVKNMAEGYIPAGGYTSLGVCPYFDWSVKTGNGSLYSTPGDLLKWFTALMAGNVVNKNSVEKMISEKYGLFVKEKMGEGSIYYNGNSPGFSSSLGYFPQKELIVIVLENNHIGIASKVGDGIAGLVMEKEVEPFENLSAIETDRKFIEALTGTYKFPYYTIEIVNRDHTLHYKGGYPNYEIPLIPISSNKLFNRFFWGKMMVERDNEGQVTYIYWEGNPDLKGERIK